MNHLTKYVTLAGLVVDVLDVVVSVQQTGDGVAVAVAGGERVREDCRHLLLLTRI